MSGSNTKSFYGHTEIPCVPSIIATEWGRSEDALKHVIITERNTILDMWRKRADPSPQAVQCIRINEITVLTMTHEVPWPCSGVALLSQGYPEDELDPIPLRK